MAAAAVAAASDPLTWHLVEADTVEIRSGTGPHSDHALTMLVPEVGIEPTRPVRDSGF